MNQPKFNVKHAFSNAFWGEILGKQLGTLRALSYQSVGMVSILCTSLRGNYDTVSLYCVLASGIRKNLAVLT